MAPTSGIPTVPTLRMDLTGLLIDLTDLTDPMTIRMMPNPLMTGSDGLIIRFHFSCSMGFQITSVEHGWAGSGWEWTPCDVSS